MKQGTHRRIAGATAALALAGAAIIGSVSLAPPAMAPAAMAQTAGSETPRYEAWEEAGNPDLQKMVDELDALVDEATKAKAANPVFLQDLRDLAARYKAAAAPAAAPAPVTLSRLLTDTFADGNYTANPAWKVSAGEYRIETTGNYVGLRSSVAAQPATAASGNLAAAVLGALLQPQSPGSAGGAKHASIYTPLKISNVFAVELELASKFTGGRFDFGPYQGASGGYAYRVAYFPGTAEGLQLLRVTPQGSTVIGSYKKQLFLEDRQRHKIRWTRDAAGAMTVSVDGTQVIAATDAGLKDPFDGFLMINSGGDYAIRSVAIDGVK